MSPGEQRRAWAYALISKASEPPPAYGSVQFLALPDGSPEKVAAVVLAAEKFAMDWEAQKAAEDLAYEAQRDSFRASWTGFGFKLDPAIEADVDREWRRWVEDGAA